MVLQSTLQPSAAFLQPRQILSVQKDTTRQWSQTLYLGKQPKTTTGC